MKHQFNSLAAADQRECLKLMFGEDDSRRSHMISAMVNMIIHKYRMKEVRSRQAWALFDRGEYCAYQRYQRGRSKKTATAKWAKAVQSKFALNRPGKKVKVWTKLPKQFITDDVVGQQHEQEPSYIRVGKAAAKELMNQGVQPSAAAAKALSVPDALAHDDKSSDEGTSSSEPNDFKTEPTGKADNSGDSDSSDDEVGKMKAGDGSMDESSGPPIATPGRGSAPDPGAKRRRLGASAASAQVPAPTAGGKTLPPGQGATSSRVQACSSPVEAVTALDDLPEIATKPLQLTQCKRAFRRAVEDKISNFKELGNARDCRFRSPALVWGRVCLRPPFSEVAWAKFDVCEGTCRGGPV